MVNKLEEFLNSQSTTNAESRPQIFDLAREDDRSALAKTAEGGEIKRVIDDYEEQEKEHFQISNPSEVYKPEFKSKFDEHWQKQISKYGSPVNMGRWVFYPWLSTLVHVLEDDRFQQVRTARNRELINSTEQKKFYETTIGIAGLSVGNSVALAIVLQGGAKHIKLADHDRLALSNLNRIRSGVEFLGVSKVEMTARQIYTINPYAEVEIFPDGLGKHNMENFFAGLTLVIDEIDNLAVKFLIREEARKRRLAVVMAADNGDNGVVDIERYDLDRDTKFFHGRMGDVTYESLLSLDKFGIGKMITRHVGPENVTERMQESLLEMGKTIVSWPQLGGAALLNGSAAAYCVRKILNGQAIEDNRALVSLDEKLSPDYHTPEAQTCRKNAADSFRKIFGL
ncbi:MAG: ThiF family adenylyltransferase [Patescibacteria group bacterium]